MRRFEASDYLYLWNNSINVSAGRDSDPVPVLAFCQFRSESGHSHRRQPGTGGCSRHRLSEQAHQQPRGPSGWQASDHHELLLHRFRHRSARHNPESVERAEPIAPASASANHGRQRAPHVCSGRRRPGAFLRKYRSRSRRVAKVRQSRDAAGRSGGDCPYQRRHGRSPAIHRRPADSQRGHRPHQVHFRPRRGVFVRSRHRSIGSNEIRRD